MTATVPLRVGTTPSEIELTEKLIQLQQTLEERFLAAGEILSQSIAGVGKLIASLDAMSQTLTSDEVKGTTTDLKIAAAKLNALPARHGARVAGITRLSTARRHISTIISDMRCALAYMRAFSVNIKIVAGGLGDMGAEFDHFAQEILGCIEQGLVQLKGMDADLAALQRELESAATQHVILGLQVKLLLPAVPDELANSASIISERYSCVAKTAAMVSILAREIQDCVARILGALQIGDITRQRVKHCEDALIDLSASAACSAGGFKEVAATACALLTAQIYGAIEDFDTEVLEIESSMAKLAESGAELKKLHELVYSSSDGSEGSFLHGLGARADEALSLVKKIKDADTTAIETGENAAKAAHRLNNTIDEIQVLKRNVQYMALNATLKCAQIGEIGSPLNVITVELRSHAESLERTAGGVLGLLDDIHAGARTLMSDDEGAEESTTIAAKDALEIAAKRIRLARDNTEKDINTIASEGAAVLEVLKLSSDRLRFRSEVAEMMDEVRDHMACLAEGALNKGDPLPEELGGVLNSISALYTMARERTIHAEFLDSLGIESAKPAEAGPDEAALELF